MGSEFHDGIFRSILFPNIGIIGITASSKLGNIGPWGAGNWTRKGESIAGALAPPPRHLQAEIYSSRIVWYMLNVWNSCWPLIQLYLYRGQMVYHVLVLLAFVYAFVSSSPVWFFKAFFRCFWMQFGQYQPGDWLRRPSVWHQSRDRLWRLSATCVEWDAKSIVLTSTCALRHRSKFKLRLFYSVF